MYQKRKKVATRTIRKKWAITSRDVGAILPPCDAWFERGAPTLSFWVTHVLTEHGCFGEYLNRIEVKEQIGGQKCDTISDSSQYTVSEQRIPLTEVIAPDLFPVDDMLDGE